MDALSNKFAAFIADRGKHSEFVFNNGVDRSKQLIKVSVSSYDTENQDVYRVPADALIFSAGLVVNNRRVEMIMCVTDISHMTFAIDNSEVSYAIPANAPSVLEADVDSEHYRFSYRALFGFDGKMLFVNQFHMPNPSRMSSPIVENNSYSTLRDLIYGNNVDTQSKMMADVGVTFVAVRTVGEDGVPDPVSWLNGNFLPSAGEDIDDLFVSLNTIVNSHLFDRYSKSLLGKACGFCPHLLS